MCLFEGTTQLCTTNGGDTDPSPVGLLAAGAQQHFPKPFDKRNDNDGSQMIRQMSC